MSKRVITFGEIMLRLAPEGYYRFVQANNFGATYGGGVSLPLVRSFWSGFLHIPAKIHGATSPGKHIPHRLVIRLE